MRRVWNTFLAGLAAVLPVSITLYLIYWLSTTSEAVLGSLLQVVLPAGIYTPGMGLVVGFIVVLLVGLMVNAYAVRWFIRRGEAWLARVPFVKTIYGAVKDFTRFLPKGGERRDLQRVVLWRIGHGYIVGFVTSEIVPPKLAAASAALAQADMVAVYFPLSYQIGGHTVFLPRSELVETQLSAEEALRLVLTGGVTATPSNEESRQDVH